MRIDDVSLFPEFVDQCAGFGVVGRARERGLLSLHGWNPRDYAEGNYRRVDQHDHARPAAERAVVDAAVVALGMVARVPAVQRQQPALPCPPDHAEAGALGDEFGEQADDVDAHQKSASQSTVITPASKSTEVT